MNKHLYAPTLRLKGSYTREFELISFSKNDDGNCAVIHFLDEGDPTPWVTVRNLADAWPDGVGYEWAYGHYFDCRRHAEKKFYEMVGVLVEKKEDSIITETPISKHCELMTIKEFFKEVDEGSLSGRNGFGYYSNGEVEYSELVDLDKPWVHDLRFTHVCWYNK